jgi:adenylate cyclase
VREAADAPSTALLPGVIYDPGPGFQPRRVALPFAELAGAAAGVGHNLLQKDPGSNFARRMLPFVDATGVAVPSLGVAAALAYQAIDPKQVVMDERHLRVGDARLPLLDIPAQYSDGTVLQSRQALLRFRSTTAHPDGSSSVFPSYSMFDVLLSADQLASGRDPAIPLSAFAGKLVFVGTSAAGTYDSYATPISDNAPGVELHATMADNLLSRRFMRRASPSAELALVAGAAIVTGVVSTVFPAVWGSVIVGVLAAGLMAWLVRQVGQGVWIASVAPLTGIGLALFGGVTWQYLVEGRGKREMRRLFGRYVSKDVIEQLTADPSMAVLGGQRRTMSVLFSDIRGFTAASEHGQPEAIVAQLNEYFSHMVEVLFKHQGTLDKFVGDMVMGLFGAPLSDARHADHAVAAALEMTSRLATLNARWKAEGKPALDIGIGINSGEMIAGNIGSEAIMSYTVIGDAVNLGARLESLNKDYGSRILISQATRDALTTTVATRLIGPVVVKGRQQPVTVYEVLTTEHSA